jgi:PilZ domain
MSSIDRRMETRVNLCVPLKFRPVTDPPSGERTAESVNLSQRGLFFSTNVPLGLGSQVEVFITMPTEISGKPPAEVRCVGRVVHIKPGSLLGKSGVGIRIERYEVLTARERWAS